MSKFLHFSLGIFYNRSERRLRALWRLLIGIFLGLLILSALNTLAGYILAFLLMLTAQVPFNALGNPGELSQDINAIVTRLPLLIGVRWLILLLLVGLAIILLARWIDRRPWQSYGFHFKASWWRDFAAGLFLGMVLMGLIFGCEYLLGWVSVRGVFENDQPQLPFWQLLIDGLIYFVLVGLREEWFFRGFQIKNLAEGLHFPRISSKASVLISYFLVSIIFGFLHAANPNATLVSSLNIILIGLFLGLSFILTGELALPIGLHIAWNFAQGYVFGFPVSGNATHISLLATQQTGPVLWTGGAFGPEGGLISVVAALLGILLVYGWVRWTHRQVSVQNELAQYLPSHPKPEKA